MAPRSDYVTGTITLTNGSTAFTGAGTAWSLAGFREGDEIKQVAGQTQWEGMVATIDSNTAGTLVRPWGGATGTYAYRMRFQPDGSRVTAQARELIELLGDGTLLSLAGLVGPGVIELLPGGGAQVVPKTDLVSGAAYDVQVANLAARAAYDGQAAGFSVLVADVGDGRAAIYSKITNASGNWSAAAYVTGPVGNTPPLTFGPVTTLPPGSAATVANTGTPEEPVLNFSIPQGASGNLSTPLPPQGRLSLVAGTPVSASDVTGATTIYYVATTGSYATIFDGTNVVSRSFGNQLAHALDSNTGHTLFQASGSVYDEWVFWDGSAVKLGNGPSWAAGAVAGSVTARGTGAGSTELELFQGLLVNKNSMQIRWGSGAGDITTVPARRATFLGSFLATANGQATDTAAARLFFNAFNQAVRPLKVRDAALSWAGVAGMRQARGSPLNQVDVLLGLAGVAVNLLLSHIATTSAAGSITGGIGLDSASAFAADSVTGWVFVDPAQPGQLIAQYNGCPGLGLHSFKWIESGTTATTWFGTLTGGAGTSGLSGMMVG